MSERIKQDIEAHTSEINAEFYCAKWAGVIPRDAVLVGCPEWVTILPSIVGKVISIAKGKDSDFVLPLDVPY